MTDETVRERINHWKAHIRTLEARLDRLRVWERRLVRQQPKEVA